MKPFIVAVQAAFASAGSGNYYNERSANDKEPIQ